MNRILIALVLHFVSFAFAFNEASAFYIYEYAKIYNFEHKNENLNLSATVLFQEPLSFDYASTKITSDGGNIFFLQTELSFAIGKGTFTPSFLFGRGKWQSGDFEYFYGKPHLPSINAFSGTFNLGNSSVNAGFYFGKMQILNNEELELFNSDFYFSNVSYKYSANHLNATIGFVSANMNANGSLTAANQHYFLFPYSFYNADGLLKIKALYEITNLSFEGNFANYALKLGGVISLYGKMNGKMHYKHRKFYGQDEVFDTLATIQLKNNGFAFAILSINSKKIKFDKFAIQYGVQKPFIIPFGKSFNGISGETKNSVNLKDAFLSMLTANANIYF
ncbi:hypothetical protein AGMMS49938_04040 [Fibrobacterales bacterium]|nr:hypothetical protein AGMMS49938_04040 [Fibrobacterales bacterium]